MATSEEGIVGSALGTLKRNAGSPSKGQPVVWYDGRREVHIHRSSVNSGLKTFQYPFLVFLEKVWFLVKLQNFCDLNCLNLCSTARHFYMKVFGNLKL